MSNKTDAVEAEEAALEKGAQDFLKYLATRFAEGNAEIGDVRISFETKVKELEERVLADEVKAEMQRQNAEKLVEEAKTNLESDYRKGFRALQADMSELEKSFTTSFNKRMDEVERSIVRGSSELQERIDNEQDKQIRHVEEEVSGLRSLVNKTRSEIEDVILTTSGALQTEMLQKEKAQREASDQAAAKQRSELGERITKVQQELMGQITQAAAQTSRNGLSLQQVRVQLLRVEHVFGRLDVVAQAEDQTRVITQEISAREELGREVDVLRSHTNRETQQMRDVVINVQKDIGHLHDLVSELRRITQLLHAQIVELKAARPKYEPVQGDIIDELVAEAINRHRNDPAYCIPIERVGEGTYRFGTRTISVCLLDGSVAVRVGGGFMSFEEFVDRYSAMESIKLRRKGDESPRLGRSPSGTMRKTDSQRSLGRSPSRPKDKM